MFVDLLFLAAFLLTILCLQLWINLAIKRGITGRDIHKKEKIDVAESGGIVTSCIFILGLLTALFYSNVILGKEDNLVVGLAICLSFLIAAFLGFADDILGWKLGLNHLSKVLLSFIIALPIIIVNRGISSMHIPFLGRMELGLLYPILFIPLFVMFASNAFNMLGGFNGLEVKMGLAIIATLTFFSYKETGNEFIGGVGTLYLLICLAFYLRNSYPAKIFPGDSFTYSTGALIAIMAIFGNLEMIAAILLIPYGLEFLLKLRGKFKMESFGKLLPDGSITNKYDKWYGLEHISISWNKWIFGKATERNIVNVIISFEIIMIFIVFMIYG